MKRKKKVAPRKKPVAKKPVDPFVEFDQQRHALALREARLSRALLKVYRYAMDHGGWKLPFGTSRTDRTLCTSVLERAKNHLEEIKDECRACCGWSCCQHGSDRAEVVEVINACTMFMESMESNHA